MAHFEALQEKYQYWPDEINFVAGGRLTPTKSENEVLVFSHS
jgi:hypothetical protein